MDLASCQFPSRWVCLKIEITMVCRFAQVLWRIINCPLQSASPTNLRVNRISITSPHDKLNDLKGAHHHFWTTPGLTEAAHRNAAASPAAAPELTSSSGRCTTSSRGHNLRAATHQTHPFTVDYNVD